MFTPTIFTFLNKLKKNNNKEWFDKNRDTYEGIKLELKANVEAVLTEIVKFDKEIIGLEPKHCIFRINRDVRFSKNKSPYKTNIGAYFSPGGKKSGLAGYYLHLEPGNVFLAGGNWQPEAPKLAAIRQEIDYNFDEFKKIVTAKDFKKHFGTLDMEDVLQNQPKGYAKDNPALKYLKLKSFIAFTNIPDKNIHDKKFVKQVADTYKAMYPFNAFLRRAVS